MLKQFKSTKLNILSTIVLAFIITAAGIGVMTLTARAQETKDFSRTPSEALELSLPGAGMGVVLDDYVGATSGSSIEYLSTTAVAGSLENTYNEYYDSNGRTIGKLIVFTGESADIYDKIIGNERIEAGEVPASLIGHMYNGDVATLITVHGDWYQIISDSVSGFVKKDGFERGTSAEALNDLTYVYAAYANGSESLLFEEDYDSSTVTCVVPEGVRCTVLEEGDELSRISVPGFGEGWARNSDLYIDWLRRYAVPLSYEIEANKRVTDGVAAAQVIEAAKEEARIAGEQKEQAQSILQAFNLSPGGPDSADAASLRESIVSLASQYVGVLPYIPASSDLTYGADCSGFTSALYRAFGYDISRSPEGQYWGGTQVPIEDARPGDIIYYSGHVGLYVGNGMIIHESVPGTTASYADMWMMPVVGVVRYIN